MPYIDRYQSARKWWFESSIALAERLLVTLLPSGLLIVTLEARDGETRSRWTRNRCISILVGFRQLCAFAPRRETECRYARASNRAYIKKSLPRKKDSLCLSSSSSSFSSSTSTSAINACHNIGSAIGLLLFLLFLPLKLRASGNSRNLLREYSSFNEFAYKSEQRKLDFTSTEEKRYLSSIFFTFAFSLMRSDPVSGYEISGLEIHPPRHGSRLPFVFLPRLLLLLFFLSFLFFSFF